jgi:chromosome segregation ATPase
MEEYLANMKTLRSYMSDLEEEATKRSAEEQRQRTAIDAHGADLAQVRAQTKQASEESEQLSKARAELCVEISEKQGRIATLEIECATLKQVISPGTDHSNSSALLGASRFTFNEFFWCLGCSTNFRLSWMKRP